jgi:hypothetical protein
MIIALLAVLGVDLIVIFVLLGMMLTRRRWLSHQPGAFRGAIRVVDGAVSGLGPKWKRGYGRWVRDVLVWTKAPALLRNELVAVDGLADAVRAAEPGEVKRLGSEPRPRRLRHRPPGARSPPLPQTAASGRSGRWWPLRRHLPR